VGGGIGLLAAVAGGQYVAQFGDCFSLFLAVFHALPGVVMDVGPGFGVDSLVPPLLRRLILLASALTALALDPAPAAIALVAVLQLADAVASARLLHLMGLLSPDPVSACTAQLRACGASFASACIGVLSAPLRLVRRPSLPVYVPVEDERSLSITSADSDAATHIGATQLGATASAYPTACVMLDAVLLEHDDESTPPADETMWRHCSSAAESFVHGRRRRHCSSALRSMRLPCCSRRLSAHEPAAGTCDGTVTAGASVRRRGRGPSACVAAGLPTRHPCGSPSSSCSRGGSSDCPVPRRLSR
jgi:hypothetical protein